MLVQPGAVLCFDRIAAADSEGEMLALVMAPGIEPAFFQPVRVLLLQYLRRVSARKRKTG